MEVYPFLLILQRLKKISHLLKDPWLGYSSFRIEHILKARVLPLIIGPNQSLSLQKNIFKGKTIIYLNPTHNVNNNNQHYCCNSNGMSLSQWAIVWWNYEYCNPMHIFLWASKIFFGENSSQHLVQCFSRCTFKSFSNR